MFRRRVASRQFIPFPSITSSFDKASLASTGAFTPEMMPSDSAHLGSVFAGMKLICAFIRSCQSRAS